MNRKITLVGVLGLCLLPAAGYEAPANRVLLVEDHFGGDALPKGWAVQTGSWRVAEGVLKGSEIEEDHHVAAARRAVRTGDAVYQFEFRLAEGSKGFHFGFDPLQGALDKKGHLFSVIVAPTSWHILKHLDKERPKEDPNEVLAKAEQTFEAGKWYDLRLTTLGDTVEVTIEGVAPLSAKHPSFGVEKPTLVFRAIGGGVEIDELRVWDRNRDGSG